MELHRLYYFYVVAKHEHVTRAAEELHVAQPALSRTIRLLEEELGVPLFYKNRRNIYLTELGKYLKERLEDVFTVLDSLPQELEQRKTAVRQTVKLNVLAASTIVTEAIVSYKKENGQAVFQVIQNEEEMDCDISVTTNTVDFSRLPAFQSRCVIEEKIFLAVPGSADFTGDAIDLEQVKDFGFVNLAGSRSFRTICDKLCLSAGFVPKCVFESDSPVAVRNLIGAGAGVGFWPAFSWGKSSEDIRLLSIRTPPCQRELIIGMHNHTALSETAAEFYEYLVEYIRRRQSQSLE